MVRSETSRSYTYNYVQSDRTPGESAHSLPGAQLCKRTYQHAATSRQHRRLRDLYHWLDAVCIDGEAKCHAGIADIKS
jgi:hypothetical protein